MREARIPESLPRGSWRRIVVVAAAVAALAGGAVSLATRAVATEPPKPTTDRLASFEASGCRELVAVPKQGWRCAGS
jgi:anti-sigma-K factor RskA